MIYKDFQGLKLSQLGFGTMRLPLREDKSIDAEQAAAMTSEAIAKGVNYFDTAWPYHSGKSELVIGENLKQSAFPGSVHSDDSETLSGFHAEGNIVKRAEFTVEMPCPAEQSLHQAMHRSGIDFINFGEIAHFNADLIR